MGRCKTILTTIVVVICLFGFVPIRLPPPKTTLNINDNDTNLLFSSYIEKYNKSYRYNETLKLQKLSAFEEALKEIKELNVNREKNSSAKFGFTKFSDMTKDEFKNKYLRDIIAERIQNRTKYIKKYKPEHHLLLSTSKLSSSLPLKVDWRQKNVITNVKNQKDCGACWAFSTIETVESMNAIKSGKVEELSVQELIDCAGYTSRGCDGGDICGLLYWLEDNNVTIQKNIDYPLNWKTSTCKLNRTKSGVKISNFTCADYTGLEESILYLLANHGPVTVAVNALLWQNYLGGVIHYHCTGEPNYLNHAVQLVGYDKTADIPYYIVRNSWGTDFGDKGYLYIAIGDNMCGLANEVASIDIM